MSVETSNPAPKRRLRWLRPQFSLRTLMIGITLLCVGFAWFGMKWRQAQAQAKAVENIKKLYGNVSYESEYDKDIHGCKFGEPSRPTLSRWLPWLGRDFFESVASVDAHFREDPFGPPPVKSDVELERGRRGISAQLKDLPNCISLKLNAKFASAKELRVLPMWKNLESLSLRNSKIDGDLLDDDLLSAVGDCHQLKHLSLGDSPINDIGLAHIGQLTNLSELCIYGRLDHPSRDGLQHLSHLHKLSKLTIFDCPNADAACEVISGLRLLTEIPICFSDISEHGISSQ